MSFKNEIEKLNPRDRKQEMATLAVGVLVATLAYYLDKARVFAFAIVPVVSLTSYATNRGIGLFKTPRLYALMILACVAIIAVVASILMAEG